MVFSLVTDPATFQKAIMDLLSHIFFTKIYLHDILTHSSSSNQSINHLKTVSSILKESFAEINFQKSTFCKKQDLILATSYQGWYEKIPLELIELFY